MKKTIAAALFTLSAIAAASMAAEEAPPEPGKFDAKVCFKRCMETADDQAKCEYICFKKKKD